MSAPTTVQNLLIPQPQAPAAPTVTVTQPWNKCVTVTLVRKSKDVKTFEINAQVAELVTNHLKEAGKVDLYNLELVYTATEAGQFIQAGTCGVNSGATPDTIGSTPMGFEAVSNSFNYGTQHIISIKVDDNHSRQIQPVDNRLPAFKFMLKASAGMKINIRYFLMRHGPLYSYEQQVFQ